MLSNPYNVRQSKSENRIQFNEETENIQYSYLQFLFSNLKKISKACFSIGDPY